jgi:hypothetical protein
MEQHKKVLGIIFIVTATLQTLGMLIVAMLASTIYSLIKDHIEPDEIWVLDLVFGILRILPWIIIAFISVPSVITGVGLLNKQRWALVMALILGCLKLFSFPIGTVIGVYSIWVYIEAGKAENNQPK